MNATLEGLVERLPPRARRWIDVAADVRRRAEHDDLAAHAGALAFAAFLSLFPLLLLTLSVAGFVAERGELVAQLVEAVPGLEDVVRETVDLLTRSRVGIGIVGLIGALWSASAIAGRVLRSMATVFGLRTRSVVVRVRSLVGTIVLGVLVLAAVAAGGALARVDLGGVLELPVELAARALAGVLLGVVAAVSYAVLTPEGVPWRDHLPGAIVTTVAWIALIAIGQLAVDRVVSRATALYGTIGAVFGLLLFIRLMAAAFLYGAELSATLRADRMLRRPSTQEPPRRPPRDGGGGRARS